MSEGQDSQNPLEKEQKVVISPEDCNAALDFWRHFNIPIPADLQTAFDAFNADPSFQNQEKVKLAVCLAISTSEHEAFKDEMFKKISEECESTAFSMQFDKDLETTVTVKQE